MPKRATAWYNGKLPALTFAFLTLVSGPFREDIREAVLTHAGVIWTPWVFDLLLTGGAIGLAFVLISKSDRTAQACEDLREQLQEVLADNRVQLNADLANHQKQLKEALAGLVDTKLEPISSAITTLQSHVSASSSLLAALDSRMAALDSRMAALDSRMGHAQRHGLTF